jgi:signal transduction histidine kinase
MSIHKRIMRSNAIMVFCSLFALFTVNGLVFQHFRREGRGAGFLRELGEKAGFEMPLVHFILFGTVSLLTIMFLNLFFTRKLAKRIMRPLDLLVSAAKRVEGGNLSEKIEYRGDGEFETLCRAFNQMQDRLLAERKKNAAYEKARTDMMAGISHDLRTPLTSVKGFIRGMMDGVADTPEKQKQYLSIAYKKSCEMDTLINRVFFFSNMETGNLPISAVDTDFAGYAERYARESREEFGADIAFVPPDGPCPVRIDPENMRRVLNNLTDNALKYAETQPLKIRIALERADGCAVLRFSDNGKGVPPDKLPRIFEQFYRADEARGYRTGTGSGLGLYIVKYLTEAQGGTAEAYNDNGLTVVIRLPLTNLS